MLWIETVWPAPAGYEVRFVGLEGDGEILDVFFGDGAAADEKKMRGDPGEIERRERAEEMSAIDGAETEGEDEVVDDAGPEVVGHAEVFRLHEGELFEAEERVGRQDERPDVVEVGVGETEGLEHGGDVGRIGDGRGVGDGCSGLDAACTLPEGGFGVDVGEEGAGDLGEETVDVGGDGLEEGAGADVDFGDGAVAGGGFVDRPDEHVVLTGGGEALRRGGETLGHAQRQAEVDGERVSGAGAEEGAGDGIEDGGVDEAFARAEIVVGYGEVVLKGRPGQGANGFGVKGLGFGAEEDAGCRVIFLREFVGVEIVGRGEHPGGGRDRGQGVGDQAEGASGGGLRDGVGGGDEDGFARECEGEIAKGRVEGFLRERDKADEEAAGIRGG